MQCRGQGTRVLTTPEYQPKGAGIPPTDAGFVKQVTDALSQKTGLPTSAAWSGAAGVAGIVAFAYHDQSLRVKSETVAGVQVHFGYDKDQLVTCASATSCAPAVAADALVIGRSTQHGGVTSLTLGSITETIEYSDTPSDLPNQAFGELRKQTVSFGSTIIAELEYDAVNRRRDSRGRIKFKKEFKKETLRNPSTHVNDVVDTEYGYDELNRLKGVKIGAAAATETEYDGNGNILKVTSPSGTVSNRTIDDQDRLESLSDPAIAYTYGPNGEATSRQINGVTYPISYDALGNLKSYANIEYVTDGMGRRVARKLNGAVTHRWLYRNGLNPIAELNAAGAVVSRFVYASRSNIPDFVLRDGKTYRIIADHLGSPRMAVNIHDVTEIPYRADYSATGEATPVEGRPLDWLPFGFAGGMYDSATKLVRFGARDYDTLVGRWLSKDPILFDGDGPKLYAYVLNDPVNRIDPTGEAFLDCAKAIANYLECKEEGGRSVDGRKEENECKGPDKGHNKAIKEKNNRCERLKQKAFNACKDPSTWGPLLIGAGVGVALGLATGGGAVAVGAGALVAL